MYSQVKEIFQRVCVLLILTLLPRALHAQSPEPGLARVFVDCNECSFDNLREELSFVDIVRDRPLADIAVMITSLPTGSGGRAFSIELLPRSGKRGDTLTVNLKPDATDIEQRELIARTLKIALIPFIRESSAASYLNVVYNPPTASAASVRGNRDRWNKWVYRLSGSGSFASDESFSMLGADGGISASHITDQIKIELSAKGSFNHEKYELSEGESITSDRDSWTAKSLVVRSISDHLSAGINASAGSSAFENTSFQLRAMPALEYDLYPYGQATQRQVIVRYGVGFRSMRYNDTTIYGQIAETRPIHELSAVADVRRPWGNVYGTALW